MSLSSCEAKKNELSSKYTLIIIGSGPAGYTAAIYAARSNIDFLMISGLQVGGQLTTTTDVENYPGFAKMIQGPWLMDQMKEQAENVGAKIIEENVDKVDLSKRPFTFTTTSGKIIKSDTAIIATGARAKWLGLPSEDNYRGFGVSSCATCDGFFFRDEVVAVIGGGNTAVEEALFLTRYAKKVYVIHRRNQFRAEKILQDRLFKNNKIEVIWDNVLLEVLGKNSPKAVTGIRIKNVQDGKEKELSLSGVFVAIGHQPMTDIFKGQLDMDEHGYIICEKGDTQSSKEGVFAAGDVQDKVYRQAVTAAGEGCKAAIDVLHYLDNN